MEAIPAYFKVNTKVMDFKGGKAFEGKAFMTNDDLDGHGCRVLYSGDDMNNLVTHGFLIGTTVDHKKRSGMPLYVIAKGRVLEPGNPPNAMRASSPGPGPGANVAMSNETQQGSLRNRAPPPVVSNGPYGAPRGSISANNFTNVKDLNPYLSKFMIKVRVSHKGDVRKYSNQKGEGQLQKIIFTDATGEIPCTIFGSAVDLYQEKLQVGKLYEISKIRIKAQALKFRSTAHECEITLDESAVVNEVVAGGDNIPTTYYSFVPISAIEGMEKGSVVDLMAVVIGATPVSQIMIKSSGQSKDKRELSLVDNSNCSINLTLWGDSCHTIPQHRLDTCSEVSVQPLVVVLKEGVVDEYMGKRVSCSFSSRFIVDPKDCDPSALLTWYRNSYNQSGAPVKSLASAGAGGGATPCMSIAALLSYVKESAAQNALDGKGYWFLLRVRIKTVKSDRKYFWEACVTCGKKVSDGDDQYTTNDNGPKFCNSCNKTSSSEKKWVCAMDIEDSTGTLDVMAMGDKAMPIIGVSCEAAHSLNLQDGREDNIGRNHDDIFREPLGQTFLMKCFARNNTYQDMKRVQYRVFEATPLSDNTVASEVNRLLTRFEVA